MDERDAQAGLADYIEMDVGFQKDLLDVPKIVYVPEEDEEELAKKGASVEGIDIDSNDGAA